jgi:4'-phosphopantetheinyl transferase
MSPVWHDGPLDALGWEGRAPVVWGCADPGRGERASLVTMLVRHLSGKDVTLARNAEGKPEVRSPGGWYISLSGRGGSCLIAAARRPVAVDREVLDDAPPLWDMMTPQEIAAVRAAPQADRTRQWLRRWTIKEVHAKLIGTPRRIAPEAIETRLIDPVHATAEHDGVSHCWTRQHSTAIETVALWADAP